MNVWDGMLDVRQVLDRRPISLVLEPAPTARLTPDATFEDALLLFEEQPLDFACVVDDGGVLEGLVTWPDLFRAMEGGAGRAAKVREFMSATSLSLTPEDSCRSATESVRERGLRALPVVDPAGGRHLVGCVRAARIVSLAVRESGMTAAPAGQIERGGRV